MIISQERREQISIIVNDILSRLNINPYNFDVLNMICSDYGFSLNTKSFADSAVTGTLLVDEDRLFLKNTDKLITINTKVVEDKDGYQRTRFIALHELGHYILHKHNNVRQFAKRDTNRRDTTEELEADYFALCMLMPESAVRNLVGSIDNDGDKIRTVCKQFGVTQKKAIWRLSDLNLITVTHNG